jgi:hypothetical protein
MSPGRATIRAHCVIAVCQRMPQPITRLSRIVLLSLVALCASPCSVAQQSNVLHRIAVVAASVGPQTDEADAFHKALREAGILLRADEVVR